MKMTPGKHFAVAFWLGFAFHALFGLLIQDWYGLEGYIEILRNRWMGIHWAWWVPAIIAVLVLYSKNRYSFEKEMSWMSLKTKVNPSTMDSGTTLPVRPPPPPPPPPMPKVKPPRKP